MTNVIHNLVARWEAVPHPATPTRAAAGVPARAVPPDRTRSDAPPHLFAGRPGGKAETTYGPTEPGSAGRTTP
jgi:hypothetical protein